MNIVFAIIADDANVAQNGKLNIVGIFGRIYSVAFPALHPKMCLVLRFQVPSVEFDREKVLRIPLVGPGGKELLVIDSKMTISVKKSDGDRPFKAEHDQIIILQNIVFPSPGDYAFHIMVGGEEKTTVPLILERTQT